MGKMLSGAHSVPQWENHNAGLRGLEHSHASCREDHMPFGKQLPACCCALVEMECMAMESQVTLHLALPFSDWVMSDQPNNRVRRA